MVKSVDLSLMFLLFIYNIKTANTSLEMTAEGVNLFSIFIPLYVVGL